MGKANYFQPELGNLSLCFSCNPEPLFPSPPLGRTSMDATGLASLIGFLRGFCLLLRTSYCTGCVGLGTVQKGDSWSALFDHRTTRILRR